MNPEDKKITRRQFLTAAGCTCAAVVAVGGYSRARGIATAAAGNVACPFGYRYDAWPGQCYRYVDSNGSGYCDFSEPLAAATTATTGQALAPAAATAAPAAATTTDSYTRVVLCDRGCGYPGQCGRFVDSDNSGVCDLTEGVLVSSAVAGSLTAGSATASSVAATATPAAGASVTSAPTATPAASSTELVILCNRNCSYPGNCGRYTDSNGTGRCDLSEGIPADQAATYSGGGGRGRGRGG